ncbi:arsenate reductase protein [Rutstroemia sp. NJR-2017a BBW]|nr:arsenate reductase protein [Rutstroemia sp. NJR-2017a BBW]
MKLHASFLLPLLVSTVSAATEAPAYLFQGQKWPSNSGSPPALSPTEARLVLAQRLGISQYHDIGSVKDSAIKHINKFGGQLKSLFNDAPKDKAAELVMIVEGVSDDTAGPLLNAWSSIKPAFTISNPPSVSSTQRLAADLEEQLGKAKKCAFHDAINPFANKCWNGKSKIMHVDLSKKSKVQEKESITTSFERLTRFASQSEMNVLIILMPSSRRSSSSYGTYSKPSQKKISSRQHSEEPITEFAEKVTFHATASNSTNHTLNSRVPRFCYASLDACVASTNNCSSSGLCYKKSSDCFACSCSSGSGRGGAACQKQDISGPFWLITISSIVLVGLVSWGIGMLYSIGDEQLPGVIGAGVSSKGR